MTDITKLSELGVAVLCGGPGAEREVSLASGDNAYRGLAGAGLKVEKVVIPEREPAAFLEKLHCGLAVMMLHGEFGEDGVAQAILERRGIAFTGSGSRACAQAMDKRGCKELFVKYGVPTPRWAIADTPAAAAGAVEKAGLVYPLFVKPNYRGSSVGVGRVNSPGELVGAVEKALAEDKLSLIEEMVHGRELTVGWLNGKVLPVIELVAEGVFYDYHAKYISDNTKYLCPAPLSPDTEAAIRKIVLNVTEFLAVRDLSRVDIMLGAAGPMVLELNTLPGFTTHSLVPQAAAKAGMGIGELCLSLVEMAAKRAGLL